MGCIYNTPPVRMKDIPYLDVLSESVNNPIRLCVGWYIVTASVLPPISLLVACWMLGAYFMALKRFSEYRQIGCESAIRYRPSFEFYSEKALLTSVMFYAATSMLFFGAFAMRYRMEMVLAFPIIALLTMAVYFDLSFVEDSPVQNPEKLYREPRLMALVAACGIMLVITSFVQLPWLAQVFPKSGVQERSLLRLFLPNRSRRPTGKRRNSMTSASSDRRLPLARLGLLTAAGLTIHGYHLGVEDGEIFIPAAKKLLDPQLYPYAPEFFLSHQHLSLFSAILAWTARLTHLSMDATVFLWYIAGLFGMLVSCWMLSSICFSSERARWCSVLIVTAVLTMPATNTGLLLIDP